MTMEELSIKDLRKIEISEKLFWDAVHQWLCYPGFATIKISGSKLLFKGRITLKTRQDTEIINYLTKLRQIKYDELNDLQYNKYLEEISEDFFLDYFKKGIVKSIEKVDDWTPDGDCFISAYIWIPKDVNLSKLTLICIEDKVHNYVYNSVYSSTENEFCILPARKFGFKYSNPNILILWLTSKSKHSEKTKNLQTNHFQKIFNKIIKWTKRPDLYTKTSSLIAYNKYNALYQELKQKYMSKIIEVHLKNKNPKKIVHDDLAIATYLILLWRQEQIDLNLEKKQTFIDLDCGSGLLVYLLTQEGYAGKGLSNSSEEIWSTYPSKTLLEVRPLVPTSEIAYPEYDWLIGNHAHELSPWIPLIAAKSSPKCRYFILPCCSIEFNGELYRNLDNSNRFTTVEHLYKIYIDYMKEVSDACGSVTLLDQLPITSARKVCIIGTKKNESEGVNDETIKNIVNKRLEKIKAVHQKRNIDLTKRMTGVTKESPVLLNAVQQIVNKLLSEKNLILDEFGKEWNKGGRLTVVEARKLFREAEYKKIKQESGGIPKLMRKYRHVFSTNQNVIQFVIPIKNCDDDYVNVQCWFHKNHPNGCPLSQPNCKFQHD